MQRKLSIKRSHFPLGIFLLGEVKALSTLSQKSLTVSLLFDSLTFLRQCGQGLRLLQHDLETFH